MTYSLRGFRTPLWPWRQRRKPLQHNESLTTAVVGSSRRMAPQRTLTARFVHSTACPITNSSTPSSHTIQARTAPGSAGVVMSSVASCSNVRERGSCSAALCTSVIHGEYRTNFRDRAGLWCLGGNPGRRSGAVSRLGGDQRRQRLRSDLNPGGWMVTHCDAGTVAGPAGLKAPPSWPVTAGAYRTHRAPTPSPSSAVEATSSNRLPENPLERLGWFCRFQGQPVVTRAMLLSVPSQGSSGEERGLAQETRRTQTWGDA